MPRNVKWSKKLAFDTPARESALRALGEYAADLIQDRIEKDGKDAAGRPLPQVGTGNRRKRGWFATSKSDPRKLLPEGEVRNAPGSSGAPTLVVDRDGYAAVKQRLGKKTTKGASLTGAMWKGLTITNKLQRGRMMLRLYFGGSQRVGAARFKNRDKARLLQFGSRAEGQGYEPAGKKQFDLMAFSAREKKLLAKFWRAKHRLLKPA